MGDPGPEGEGRDSVSGTFFIVKIHSRRLTFTYLITYEINCVNVYSTN